MRRSEASQAYEEFLRLKAQVVEEGGRVSRGGIEDRERLWTLVERLTVAFRNIRGIKIIFRFQFQNPMKFGSLCFFA